MLIPNIDSKIIMQGVHLELTEAMRQAIREKFSVLVRHNEHIIRINLRLQLDQSHGTQHHYHVTGEIELGGPNLVASTEGTDAYVALDELVSKLDELLRRRHSQRKDKRNHPQGIELDSALPKAVVPTE